MKMSGSPLRYLRNLGLGLANFAIGLAVIATVFVFSLPPKVEAAATTQTTHAWLCMPEPAIGAANHRVVVPTTTGGTYNLNGEGCALVVGADVGWFLSQGAYYGPNIFTLRQEGITATTTSSTSTITLPAYAVIQNIVLNETSGQSVTGGVDIGDSGSATRFTTGTALAANGTVVVSDGGLTRVFANSGVPAADQILVACHTSCNSSAINITVIYSYW